MAISYVAGASDDSDSASSLTITLPSHQEDDFALAICMGHVSGSWTETADGGWTELDEQAETGDRRHQGAVFYKVLTDAETNPTFDYSSTEQIGVVVLVFRGVDPNTPFDVTFSDPTHYWAGVNTDNPTPDPITTNTDGAWVVVAMNAVLDNITAGGPPSGYTLRESIVNQFDRQIVTATKEVASAGTETPGAWTHTIEGGDEGQTDYQGWTLALKPQASGAAVEEDFTTSIAVGLSTFVSHVTMGIFAPEYPAIAVGLAAPFDVATTGEVVMSTSVAVGLAAPFVEFVIDEIPDDPNMDPIVARERVRMFRLDDRLHVVPLGRGARQGFRPSEGWEQVSDTFICNALDGVYGDQNSAMDVVASAWATHSGSSAAVLEAAIHQALDTAGFRRPNGRRLVEPL